LSTIVHLFVPFCLAIVLSVLQFNLQLLTPLWYLYIQSNLYSAVMLIRKGIQEDPQVQNLNASFQGRSHISNVCKHSAKLQRSNDLH
jgi:hypothetical protein